MKRQNKIILFFIFLVISLFVSIFSGYFGLNQSAIESFVTLNHTLGASIYLSLFIILATFSFSVSIMTSVGAIFFTIQEMILYAMLGVMCSSIIHFFISKKLGRDYVRSYIKKRGGALEKFDKVLEKDTFKTTLILSAIFFVPPSIPNLLGGIMKINFKKFCLATFLGNLPNTVFTICLINGFLYSNLFYIYISIPALILTTLTALYFYKGEISHILRISFPWFFKKRVDFYS